MRRLISPHFNTRPPSSVVDLIVLHAISLPDGEFEQTYIDDFFIGKLDTSAHPSFAGLENVQVSAHFVVSRQGEITQFVPCEQRAWHAGQSSWQGRESCNDYTIGIEIIGDEKRPFTDVQYTETARLCRVLMQHYRRVLPERIVGHKDIAPNRKWDPGKQWDWARFHRSLVHIQTLNIEVCY
ncbi:MAG: 1,6-anhydro-N-acetylmuramyl-L-alanine amidase AmpD [Mariprofundaceae bacterium]|nr:1,6-anhydro-N-acetylmuramyl-L-alanine amidase AmpD [Mariprofundaceae bacterium]